MVGVGNFAGGGDDFIGTFPIEAIGTSTDIEGELPTVEGGDFIGALLIGAIGTSAGMKLEFTDDGFTIGGFFMSGGGCNNRGGAFFGTGPVGAAGIVFGRTRGAGGTQSFGGVVGIGGGGGAFGGTTFPFRSLPAHVW